MNRAAKSALVGIASLFAVTAASAEQTGYTALVTSGNGSRDSGVSSTVVNGVADLENCRKLAQYTRSATYTSVVCLNKRGEVEGSNTCRADSMSSASCSPN